MVLRGYAGGGGTEGLCRGGYRGAMQGGTEGLYRGGLRGYAGGY